MTGASTRHHPAPAQPNAFTSISEDDWWALLWGVLKPPPELCSFSCNTAASIWPWTGKGCLDSDPSDLSAALIRQGSTVSPTAVSRLPCHIWINEALLTWHLINELDLSSPSAFISLVWLFTSQAVRDRVPLCHVGLGWCCGKLQLLSLHH